MEGDFGATQKLRFDTVTTVDFVDAVFTVAKYGQVYIRQVRANLVRAPRDKLNFQQAQLP